MFEVWSETRFEGSTDSEADAAKAAHLLSTYSGTTAVVSDGKPVYRFRDGQRIVADVIGFAPAKGWKAIPFEPPSGRKVGFGLAA